MALYRRYRPQRFQDVIGQEQVTKPLMAALRANKTAHAYLFSGPRGCGKTTSARILARCLNCAEAPTDTPCGECESCCELSLEGSGSLDVVEMDAASHGGVDDARDLIERASFAPVRDRFKIFIIDEAHMVSNQGFNALLKLVEEPPPHIKFIFATTEPEKVIGTIRSRTHHYPFRLVPPDTLEHFLGGICADEGIEVGAGVLPLVVRSGGGSVRDSLSVLDQLIGGSEGATLRYQDAVGLLGYTDGSLLDDVVEALAANDGATVFSVVDRVVQSGHDPRRFVEDLLQRLRDLIVIALAGESATDVLASVPRDQYERMVAQSNHLGAARSSRCADLVNDALSAMVGATSPRLQLELLCARLLLPESPVEAAGASRSERGTVQRPARPAAAQRPAASQQGEQPRPASSQHHAAPPGAHTAQNPTASGRQVNPTWAAPVARQEAGHAEAGPQRAVAQSGSARNTLGQNRPVRQGQAAEGGAPSREAQAERGQRASEPGGDVRRVPEQDEASRRSTGPDQKADPDQNAGPDQKVSAQASAPSDGPRPKDAALVGADASIIRQRWNEVVAAVQAQSRSTAALIQTNAQVGSFSGGVLVLAFQTAGLATTFNNRGHAPRVEAALHDVLGIRASVQGAVGDGSSPKAPAPPERFSDPVIPKDPNASNSPAGKGTQRESRLHQAESQQAQRTAEQPALRTVAPPASRTAEQPDRQATSQPASRAARPPVSPAAQTASPTAYPQRALSTPPSVITDPADPAGVLAQLVDCSIEEILAKSVVPPGHVTSRAAASVPDAELPVAPESNEENAEHREGSQGGRPARGGSPNSGQWGEAPPPKPHPAEDREPTPPFDDREPPSPFEEEEPFYAQQMPTPPRPQDLEVAGASAPSSATPPASGSAVRIPSGQGNQNGTTPPMRMGSTTPTPGAAAVPSHDGDSIASRIRRAHGGGPANNGGFPNGGFPSGGHNGYRGYSDRSALTAVTDDDDEVSADDPTIAQSNLVGIDVVLDTFKGTVIEEVVGEKEN